jgi:hypothetical protein
MVRTTQRRARLPVVRIDSLAPVHPSLFPLVVGSTFVLTGVIFLIRRANVAEFFAAAHVWAFGRRGARLASWTTPSLVARMGIYFIVLGALMAGLSVASMLGAFADR